MLDTETFECYDDHIIETTTGKRYGLDCRWSEYDTPIPDFLIIDRAVRKEAWKGVKLTDAYHGGLEEEWKTKERLIREARAEEDKLKNAAGLKRMEASHPGQRYDRKTKKWVTVAVAPNKEDPHEP